MSKPDLEQSIRILKAIRSDLNHDGAPKHASQVYLGAIGLLYYLKIDQGVLLRIGHQAAKDNIPPKYPPPTEIPAISAVVHDVQLFRALVRCLSATAGGTTTENETTLNERPSTGRKRSLSFNTTDSNATKLIKLNHSPVPAARKVMAENSLQSGAKKPTFSVAVLAATVLYTAFQHLDHWPAPLVKAYADDMFGPRLWVDDSRCKCLVQNLALAHSTNGKFDSEPSLTPQELIDSARVAEAYRNMAWTEEDVQRHSPTNSVVRRGSMSSTGSVGPIVKSASSTGSVEAPPGSSDSDSGDEEEHIVTTAVSGEGNGDGSSASGQVAIDADATSKKDSKANKKKESKFLCFYPLKQGNLNFHRVRQRFFGANVEFARYLISTSLHDRLDVKSKQNSGLLQSLPAFTSIPKVRSIVASHLPRWLQSPALAGLARTLFSATVNQMQNVDPPMPDDLSTIDSILAMRLKANQLNAHIENVTAIARRIPTGVVARHMYSKLLKEELECLGRSGSTESNCLKMIGAIHSAMPPQISYDAIASALLVILVQPLENGNRAGRDRLISRLRRILRLIASEFGPAFDGCQLIESFFSLDVSSGKWSPRDEEDKARLMLQCITLTVAPYVKENGKENGTTLTKAEESELRESLMTAKKMLLTWCCTDYGPRCSGKLRKRSIGKKGDVYAGAGVPNFRSALSLSGEEKIPAWLNTMRCLLFIEDSDSELLEQFVLPNRSIGEDDPDWESEAARLHLCCNYGGDVTDDLFWIVLKSSTPAGGDLEAEMAVQLLENLLECCGGERKGTLRVSDPMLVWELYNLVHYSPRDGENNNNAFSDREQEMTGEQNPTSGKATREVPRLAYPDLWWRVTIIALVMCGHADEIGTIMWKEHPTLRGLVKMVTSTRYRFPTIDCDDTCREIMKKAEQDARDEESRVAELLFLPPRQQVQKTKKTGSRVSRRLLKQQQEKEAAREFAEKSRRKKMLRAAQKSIMLWDPDGPARKPPREVADLILSVDEIFDLSDAFQRSKHPDFLSMTIGGTTRAAVERAYEWLIPVISRLPETIVRLQSSTSCFLLLRAYGADGEERKQLKELAEPLLRHVRESLKGQLGVEDSVKAFELLMSDVASPSPERRRCARRVLRDALTSPGNARSQSRPWMVKFLDLDHASLLVSDAVKYMASAATFERGSVLRSLIVALEKSIVFAEENKIGVDWRFQELLIELISRRPSVFAEAIDAFLDLRSITVEIVHDEFARCVTKKDDSSDTKSASGVEITLHKNPFGEGRTVKLPLPVIRSTAVLLSIWKEEYAEDEKKAADRVNNLTDCLMRTVGSHEAGRSDEELVSAKGICETGDAAPVEFWIMLAKARSDSIARRAALSAPAAFLPRLLLCSGLPRASLLNMIDRLGHLGESASDMEATYLELLEPSASSQWDIGRLGRKRDTSRKLLGRLSAYFQLHNVALRNAKSEVSVTFVSWLSATCTKPEAKQKKSKQKKCRDSHPLSLRSITSASSLLQGLSFEKSLQDSAPPVTQVTEKEDPNKWIEHSRNPTGHEEKSADSINDDVFVKKYLQDDNALLLEATLCLEVVKEGTSMCHLATVVLNSFLTLSHASNELVSCVLKWIPRLSKHQGIPALWTLVFSPKLSPTFASDLILKCAETWTQSHVRKCQEWICGSYDTARNDLDVERLAHFLLHTCPSINSVQVTTSPSENDGEIGEDLARCYRSVAADCILRTSKATAGRYYGRNSLPVSFELSLLAASRGKAQFQSVCDMVIERIGNDSDNESGSILRALVLRLYLRHPGWMNLGLENVRSLLMKASESLADQWVCWRSSLDDQLEEAIDALRSGNVRLSKIFSDLSRKHPLIVLRKSAQIVAALEFDAGVSVRGEETRGTVYGRAVNEPRDCVFMGRIVKASFRHWGYSYTEPVWFAILDAITTAPHEVLFGCGLRIGLLDVLSVFLKLQSVQSQLLSMDKSKRLGAKLLDVFEAFKQNNPEAWRRWLGSFVDGGQVRHILIGCGFIKSQDAVDSLRDAPMDKSR